MRTKVMNRKHISSTLIAAAFLFSSLSLSSLSYAQESQSDEEPQRSQHERSHGERKHKSKHHKRKHHKRMVKFMMQRIDTNKDGKVDLNEYLANSEQRFQTMDINSDGYVTPEEAREGHKLMREKMRKTFKENRQAKRDAQENSN